MSDEPWQSTVSLLDEGRDSPSDAQATAIRWVSPLPPRPAAWLFTPSVTIGRDADCELRVDSNHVSRHHAKLTRSGALWLIADLDSKNGVYVNGKRVASAALGPGDVLRIGDSVGVVVQTARGTDLGFRLLAPGIYGGREHRNAVAWLSKLAESELPVVIEGATGTGKERFARALHERSGRRGPFIAVNCAVYSKALAAAELFGYRKGAFTGAEQASAGQIRAAEHGTLLLDELIELPLDVQAMLLRVIENRELFPLGETRPIPTDVRILATSQVPLATLVEQGRFRADLQARIEGAVVRLPRLRECREIIPDLFALFFERAAGRGTELSATFSEYLCVQDWALNVRELESLARRLAVSHEPGRPLEVELLNARSTGSSPPESAHSAANPKSIPVPGRAAADDVYAPEEVEALLAALTQCAGNVSRAAAQLGLSRARVYRMLEAAKKSGRWR